MKNDLCVLSEYENARGRGEMLEREREREGCAESQRRETFEVE